MAKLKNINNGDSNDGKSSIQSLRIRLKTMMHSKSATNLQFENITEGETIHQRCVIVKGIYHDYQGSNRNRSVLVRSLDQAGKVTFPEQSWPIVDGMIKVLLMLSPGLNRIVFQANDETELNLEYVPLLQSPPLHLAIMIASDSPLVIDCPPARYGGFSSAHASLDAAIAKFRMTAYMWQALTAEDMRMKGLGRRSFRLEEEWTTDTTSSQFTSARNSDTLYESGAMRSTAKVHLIRSDKTTKEIQDPDRAQQNESAQNKNQIMDFFFDALRSHGPPFESSSRPIVSGLILDSHYSIPSKLILGHAALGCHQPRDISLGMFGSHLTYSWPRFMEEVTSCLTDTKSPGSSVGNDCGECGTMWEACSIGQGAALHEVGHAFGAPHTTGIMARGYAQHWPRNFLTKTAFCSHYNQDGSVVIDGKTENNARWDMKDALSFRQLPHFWLPSDPVFSKSAPLITFQNDEDIAIPRMEIRSSDKIAQIYFNDQVEAMPTATDPLEFISYTLQVLESRFDTGQPLKLSVLAMNGKQSSIPNVWRAFKQREFIRIPSSDIKLRKQSIVSQNFGDEDGYGWADGRAPMWHWATLLTRKKPDGTIEHATAVEVRTGCILDGAYVWFGNDKLHCGPRVDRNGHEMHYGGHASETLDIPQGQEIVKVEVNTESHYMGGLRMFLSNGDAGGALSGNGDNPEPEILEPRPDERIIGFYGQSRWSGSISPMVEFGIITAPKDYVLPASAYDLSLLQNTDGGNDLRNL